MKKTAIAICALAVAAVIGTGVVMSSASTAEKASVGAEKALEIALSDAGISKEQAKNKSSVFTKEHGKYVFDVDFDFENKEYDYKIGAKDGSIVDRDVESDDDKATTTTAAPSTETTRKSEPDAASTKVSTTAPVTEPTTLPPQSSAAPETTVPTTAASTSRAPSTTQAEKTTKNGQSYRISATEAKKIALENAGISASKATFSKVKLEKDDGIYEYEIEFIADSKEYDYKINASNGKILEKDVESVRKETFEKAASAAPKPTSGLISLGQAKSAALSHAGLSESEVIFKKVKLEKDDGVYEYEVEFQKGFIEYEYTINAKDGSIIDFEKEIDD